MPQQWFGQQGAALPNKLRRYARMHTCNLGLSSNTWHKRMPHDSPFLSVGHSVARKSRQEMIILSLPRRKSFWFSPLPTRESPWSKASRRPPSQEWRTRRKELFRLGAQTATSGDCKTVFSSQTTQRQCCSSSLEERSDFMSPANHTRSKASKRKMLPRTWRRLFGLMRDSWPALRWWRAAPQPAGQLIWRSTCTARHEHSFWARASRIRYGHIQTKLTFICGFSLNPPPPPPPVQIRLTDYSCWLKTNTQSYWVSY